MRTVQDVFPNLTVDLTVRYELIQTKNEIEDGEISKEMSDILERTQEVFPFTNNKIIPVWTKSLLFNSNKIKEMPRVIKHINSSVEQHIPGGQDSLEFNRISNLLMQDIFLKPLSDIQLKDLKATWASKRMIDVKL